MAEACDVALHVRRISGVADVADSVEAMSSEPVARTRIAPTPLLVTVPSRASTAVASILPLPSSDICKRPARPEATMEAVPSLAIETSGEFR